MHILIDLDGTLTDPAEGIVACIRYALAQMDIEVGEDVKLESFIGPPLRDTFRKLCGNDEAAGSAVAWYRERFTDTGLYENRLYDGIPRCLEQLAAGADSLYLATSKPTVYSERIVEHFGISRFFRAIYGSELDGSLADKSDLLGHILSKEAIVPQQCVMIGDRSFDMIAARNHGIRAIGVLWGYGSEAELTEAGADALCSHPGEVYRQIFH